MDRYSDNRPPQRPGRTLRDAVREIDGDILKLLLRRYNLLRRMRNSKGFLDAEEERSLRASWQTAATGVSPDARLSVQFFSLMQEVEFFPKDDDLSADDRGKRQSQLRAGFNLAPAQKPAQINMRCPLSCRATRGLLMLAAATGSPLVLEPCLMNTSILSCIRMLNQAGADLTWDGERITANGTTPLDTPDKSLHVGDSSWNFFLILAHYLWQPSRVRLAGDKALKLADFSAIRHFLPSLGARLASVIPKSNSLPIRLECSGDLPDTLSLPHDVPPEFGEALLLTAHGHGKKIILDTSGHPHGKLIQNRLLFLLSMTGADIRLADDRILLMPGNARLDPKKIVLPVEPELAVFLLALPLVLGGETVLEGFWPQWPQAAAGLRLLRQCGLDLRENGPEIRGKATRIVSINLTELPQNFPADWIALPLALASCAALRDEEAKISIPQTLNDDTKHITYSFLRAVGLAVDEDGRLCKKEQTGGLWNAPDPVWALAFALTACAHSNLKLGNPGILNHLYPGFWRLYNALPTPTSQKTATPPDPEKPAQRRRVISSVPAQIPSETAPVAPGEEASPDSESVLQARSTQK
jgi:5-enolpyruvylshikimate-3-phosphate synthase